MTSAIPPTSGPHFPQFELGGKNHIAYELWQYMIAFRNLINDYPQDLKNLENFLEKLQQFLGKNKQHITQQCAKNGWKTSTFMKEFTTATSSIKDFLQNPHGGEGPLFTLNEALLQTHTFLVQTNVH